MMKPQYLMSDYMYGYPMEFLLWFIWSSVNNCSYGEENGWQCKENSADYVWVLDPIDGTKSFITGTFLIVLLRYS